MVNVPKLEKEGFRVYLDRFKDDPAFYETYLKWIKDETISSGTGKRPEENVEDVKKTLEGWAKSDNKYHWIVYRKENGNPLGDVFFDILDQDSEFKDEEGFKDSKKPAEFAVMIAESGRGFGTESLRLSLEYAFNEVKVDVMYITIYKENLPSLRLHKKFGFKHLHSKIEQETGKEEDVLILTFDRWKEFLEKK